MKTGLTSRKSTPTLPNTHSTPSTKSTATLQSTQVGRGEGWAWVASTVGPPRDPRTPGTQPGAQTPGVGPGPTWGGQPGPAEEAGEKGQARSSQVEKEEGDNRGFQSETSKRETTASTTQKVCHPTQPQRVADGGNEGPRTTKPPTIDTNIDSAGTTAGQETPGSVGDNIRETPAISRETPPKDRGETPGSGKVDITPDNMRGLKRKRMKTHARNYARNLIEIKVGPLKVTPTTESGNITTPDVTHLSASNRPDQRKDANMTTTSYIEEEVTHSLTRSEEEVTHPLTRSEEEATHSITRSEEEVTHSLTRSEKKNNEPIEVTQSLNQTVRDIKVTRSIGRKNEQTNKQKNKQTHKITHYFSRSDISRETKTDQGGRVSVNFNNGEGFKEKRKGRGSGQKGKVYNNYSNLFRHVDTDQCKMMTMKDFFKPV